MKHKHILLFCLILLLSACGGGEESDTTSIVTEPIVAGDYQILKNFASNSTRQTHNEFNRGWYDREAVGKGLEQYSKQHYSPDSYYLMEGQLITREELQPGVPPGNNEGLLGRESADNEYGLNPTIGSDFPINTNGNSIEVGATTFPIVDIFEIDFTSDANDEPTIEGASFAIVVNKTISDAEGNEVEISDDQLFLVGEEASARLASHLRQNPEIGNNTPLYITVFMASSSDDMLPGSFIAEGYGRDSITLSRLSEDWAIFSSDKAIELDAVVSQQFDSLRSQLFLMIPNDIGIVGKGKFIDNKLESLQITVTAQASTYTESSAIVQYINEQLELFDSDTYSISVRFENNGETYAMIKREIGSKDTNVILY